MPILRINVKFFIKLVNILIFIQLIFLKILLLKSLFINKFINNILVFHYKKKFIVKYT